MLFSGKPACVRVIPYARFLYIGFHMGGFRMDTERFVKGLLEDSQFLGSAKDSSYGLSASHLRKLKKAKLKVTLLEALCISREGILQEAGKMLLLDNNCASDYYDLLTMFEMYSRKLNDYLKNGRCESAVSELLDALDKFCARHSELEYDKFIRDWHMSYIDDAGELYSLINVLHVLLIEWWGRGCQASGFSCNRVSVCSNLNASLLEILLVLLASCSDNGVKFSNVVSILAQKDLNAGVAAFQIFNGQDALSGLISTIKTEGYAQFTSALFSNSFYGSFVNVFLTEDSPNRAFQCAFLQREDFSKDNAVAGVSRSLIEVLGFDCLKRRRLFVREKGVVIRFAVPFDGIDRIFVKEIHDGEYHYLFVEYKFNDGYFKRDIVFDMLRIDNSYYQFLYEKDYTVLLGILIWLGLLPDLQGAVKAIIQSEGALPEIAEVLNGMLSAIAKHFAEDNITYEEPVGWNYQCNRKQSVESGERFVVAEKMVSVGRYTRRLPSGAHASEEAKNMAAKYCLELKDGYTFVDAFERKQAISVKMPKGEHGSDNSGVSKVTAFD